ncbi:MAG: hypothetical protein A2521_11245 [Deltaproteobacteria bacterium RIFOXYD12_FULL_57_12]|nr:MAG: hypothetical protein A2521_11245 [Deltaproteobacteria bacterium RIFOXYD12_FULL_57_12]
MAEKEKEKETNPDETGGKSNKKLFIIIGAVAMLLIAGVGVGAYFLGAKFNKPAVTVDAAGQPAEPIPPPAESSPPPAGGHGGGAPPAANQIGPVVDMDEFVVNLLDVDTNRYLKAKITIELDKPEAAAEIQANMAQVRDAVLLLTGNKTYAELRDLQGKMQLRAELISHLNTLLKKGQVKKVYFTNFVIQ